MPVRPILRAGDISFVPLTKGYTAMIDSEDADQLSAWNWHAIEGKWTVYAARTDSSGNCVFLHRVLLNAPSALLADHRDGNGLHNRKKNLRPATHGQNQHNGRLRKDNRSGIKGVFWDAQRGKWKGQIKFEGVLHYVGHFSSLEEAEPRMLSARLDLHKNFCRLR